MFTLYRIAIALARKPYRILAGACVHTLERLIWRAGTKTIADRNSVLTIELFRNLARFL